MYKELQATKIDPTKLAGDILGLMIPLAGNVTQQIATMVDLYLEEEYAPELAILHQLSKEDTKEADDKILGYIREAMRLAPVVIGLRELIHSSTFYFFFSNDSLTSNFYLDTKIEKFPARKVTTDTVVQDGERTLNLKSGDIVIVGISKAHMDPVAFPNPTKIDPTRKAEDYILLG